ncbi:MAG TPA: NAD(P)-dependent oxidoreductase [Planctomycetes bacterium]|nr:NAD(P)-dependent oxidoreductase [Planctomycetota bacterium]
MSDAPVHVILGASGGIGSELARRLAARGQRPVLAARRAEPLAALGDELAAPTRALDARDWGAVLELCRWAREELGRLDGVACCVGSIVVKPAHTTKLDELQELIEVNLITAFGAVQAAAKAKAESVLLFGSAAARVGLPSHEAIAAAKGGVLALARSAAATYASRGMRVNAIAPGLVRTPGSAALLKSEANEQASIAMHALGRLGEPGDVAELAALLLDPASAWITGQVFGADGGLATLRGRPRVSR